MDDIYWNSISFGSEESLQEPVSRPYVDPWDLENYAYIRSHLDAEISSEQSTGDEFAEQNSTSFSYIPGSRGMTPPKRHGGGGGGGKYDSLMTEQGGYAAIDEVNIYDRRPKIGGRRVRSHSRDIDFDSDSNESPYEDGQIDPSLYVYGVKEKIYRKLPTPLSTMRDRSLSFSYGDYGSSPRNEIYSRLDDMTPRRESTVPIYEDARYGASNKPNNFGLSNYGHLKIDYSYSWNSLDKYICK
ncbi:unnamed protein product [Brassicogethes aeneus]|uniref:Uncharacterized protein n=1 Tax=Brassicogethes aeneus TaxID=1431903 RepID=A0A9P0B1R5_BRAAE|nr:unnamed protein product [Brassicogethes aeneus]